MLMVCTQLACAHDIWDEFLSRLHSSPLLSSQVSTTSLAGCTWIHSPGSDDSLIRCVWFISSPSWQSQSLSSPLKRNIEDAVARGRIITLLINRLICIISGLILVVNVWSLTDKKSDSSWLLSYYFLASGWFCPRNHFIHAFKPLFSQLRC